MENKKATIETGATTHPNVIAIRNYQAVMAKGEYEKGAMVFDPKVTYTVPGNNALSGIYKGPQQVMGYLRKLMGLTHGTYGISEMHWLVNEKEQVILFIKNYADLRNRHYEWEETILFEFKNGRKYNIEHYQAHQQALDEFLGL